MARTEVVATTLEGSFGDYGAGDATITTAAHDAIEDDYVQLQDGDILLAYNTTGGALTFTVSSVADPEMGRTGDITAYSVAANKIAAVGPLTMMGWAQPTTGWLHLTASAVGIHFGVLRGF